LKKHLEEVAERQKDRHFSEAQTAKLLQDLKDAPKVPVTIETPLNDAEADRFALELRTIFSKAGWQLTALSSAWDKPIIGVRVEQRNAKDIMPATVAVILALKEAGLDVEPMSSLNIREGELLVIVGTKPQT